MLRALRSALSGGRAQPEPQEAPLGELSPADRQIVERALPYTMTGVARLQAVVDAVRYCVARELPGRVRRVRRLARRLGAGDDPHAPGAGRSRPRHLPLRHLRGDDGADASTTSRRSTRPALETWSEAQARGETAVARAASTRARSTSEAVRATLLDATGYPAERLHFVRGPVEETLPGAGARRSSRCCGSTPTGTSPRATSSSTSTRGSCDGGVLIIDDYGHWEGARRAVDEYFARHGRAPLLLSRIDYTGRIGRQALSRRRTPRAASAATFRGVTPSRRDRGHGVAARCSEVELARRARRRAGATACSASGPSKWRIPGRARASSTAVRAEHVARSTGRPARCSCSSSAGGAPAAARRARG